MYYSAILQNIASIMMLAVQLHWNNIQGTLWFLEEMEDVQVPPTVQKIQYALGECCHLATEMFYIVVYIVLDETSSIGI